MRVLANGEPVDLAEGAGLADLFGALGVSARWVVAELNGEPVDRARASSVALRDGDRVELVRAVAGG